MSRRALWPWLVGAAIGVAAVVSLGPSVERKIGRRIDHFQARRLAMSHGGRMDQLFDTAFRHVVLTEGGGRYDAINRNSDNAGLSWGVIQFAQAPGSLGHILASMHAKDPARFRTTFGAQSDELLAATAAKGVRPVGGANLWDEPWLARFKAAGRDLVWQQVQRDEARSIYWTGAVEAAVVLGLASERALTMFFDTSVNQGPGFAAKLARRVRDLNPSASSADLLRVYANSAGYRFRLTTEPTSPHPSAPRIQWRKTGNEWHAWAGSFDLYATVTGRKTKILADGRLSDTPVALA